MNKRVSRCKDREPTSPICSPEASNAPLPSQLPPSAQGDEVDYDQEVSSVSGEPGRDDHKPRLAEQCTQACSEADSALEDRATAQ